MAHPKRKLKKPRGRELKTVPAGRTRQRMLTLSRHGLGRKAVHEVTGLNHRTLQRIKTGKTKYVRKETQQLIFSVPFNAHCDRALIDAGPTVKLIDRIKKNGFTQSEIARRLSPKVKAKYRQGYAPLLIARKGKVIAQTAMKVERFYNRLMAEVA